MNSIEMFLTFLSTHKTKPSKLQGKQLMDNILFEVIPYPIKWDDIKKQNFIKKNFRNYL